MVDKLEELVIENKPPGLNNLETHVVTDKRLNNYLVMLFSGLNEAQIFKMPCSDNRHHEMKEILSFKCLNSFKPNEHTEDYQITKTKR